VGGVKTWQRVRNGVELRKIREERREGSERREIRKNDDNK